MTSIKLNSNGKKLSSLDYEHPFYKWWVLISVMIGTFMAVLDMTIVSVGLPKMMATFGVGVDRIEWVLTGYLLIFAVVLPSSGWIADHFGYKKTYFFGLLLFTVGSLLCSLSWDENILILFRLIQGAGAGFVVPVGMAIVTEEFPPEKLGIALGFWGIAAAASVSLGPLVGGYLIDKFSWHTIFDVNVPIGVIGLAATWIIQREHKAKIPHKFDIVGFISMALALTSLLLALSEGNSAWNTGGWTSTFILYSFGISAFSFIIFFVAEANVKYPIVELSLFKNFNFGMTNFIMFVFGIAFFGNAFLLPIYLQNSLGYTALQAGLVFLPVGIAQVVISPIAGKLTDRINAKLPAMFGILLLAISLYLMSFFSLQTEHSQIMLPLYIRGFALGFIFIPLSAIALIDIPKAKLAQATGLFNTTRQIGGSLGIAFLGTLLTRRVIFHTQTFAQYIDPSSPVYHNTLTGLKYFALHSFGSTPFKALIQAKVLINENIVNQAFVQGINDDFFIGAVLTIALIIPLLFLRTKKKNIKRND